MEAVEAFVGQELGCAVVEVRVELVDHGLIAEHREQKNRKSWDNKKNLSLKTQNKSRVT